MLDVTDFASFAREHLTRRVVRYERDGTVTTIAERIGRARLNSPNDVVVHPDGSIWFTDPSFGIAGYWEGEPAEQVQLRPAAARDRGRVQAQVANSIAPSLAGKQKIIDVLNQILPQVPAQAQPIIAELFA